MQKRNHRNATNWRSLAIVALVLLAGVLSAGAAFAGLQAGAPSAIKAGPVTSTKPADAKINRELLAKFNTDGADAQVNYWVVLADQADTSNNIPNSQWAEKGWYVYNTLTKKANETQKPVISGLNSLQTEGKVTRIESYWIVNMVGVTGNLASVQAMAAQESVSEIKLPLQGYINDTVDTQALSPEAQAVVNDALAAQQVQKKLASLFSPLIVQHNLNEVHAPQAWTLGYDGTGVVVGSMDTGVRWTHEALTGQYRGNVAPPDPAHIHDYNWFDGYMVSADPIDQDGHGSHTMGTSLGVSPNATYGNIGVAKGATWITVRICNLNGVSGCDGDAIARGFQWTLAPTRVGGYLDPRPDLRPRVSNNSWGGGSCDTTANQAVTNWVNAGIFPSFSTGNDGPGVGTVGSPASAPDATGVGNLATNNANWIINTSSSRGPSDCDGSIRPHVVAPGTLICSSVRTSDTSYSCGYTGTSMAAPHVTGAIAILAQKNNTLDAHQLTYILTSTAFFSPTWGTLPNNNYGWGLIQIEAALNAMPVGPTATPTVTGTPPTATLTATATATACVSSYSIATSTATIIPGTNDIGSACDDCTTTVNFPWPIDFYGTTYNSGLASSNGNLQFTGNNSTPANRCLPKAAFGATAFLLQADLRTDETTCTGGCGIFTATVGVAPNRIFVIEWRTTYFGASGTSNEEILFHENAPGKVTMVYGANSDNGLGAVSGIQYNGFAGPASQFSCAAATLTNGLQVDYNPSGSCPTATPAVPTATPTNTVAPTVTPGGPTATPVACTIEFADVLPGNTFYATIHCLACQGIINGYPCGGDGEPCNGTNDPYFRPSNNITRGQLAKVVSQSAGYNEPVTGQTFEDVAPGTTFYDYVGRLAIHDVMGGYPCGVDPNEPCGNGNLPYFRPGANATRGQLTKIVSNAAGFSDPDPSTFTFTDVPPGSTFHLYVERLLINRPGAIGGYPCGSPGEPCDDQNRPYFRPSNTLTRGQTSKIVTNTFFPGCVTR